MVTKNSSDSSDFQETIKCRNIKRGNEIKKMFDLLNIKIDHFPEFRRIFRNSVNLLMKYGATNANISYVKYTCAKRILEQTVEVDFLKEINLVTLCLENLMNLSGILRQVQRDLKHHKNTSNMLAAEMTEDEYLQEHEIVSSPITSGYNLEMNSHSKVLCLKKEIALKKAELKKLKVEISDYEVLPPDINLARKMLDEAKAKAEVLNNDFQFIFGESFLETSSSSFSP